MVNKTVNRKVFDSKDEDGKTLKLAVEKPKQDVVNDAELKRIAEYSKALRLGAMTNAEATQYIEENKIWTAKDDKKSEKMRKEINDLSLLVKKGGMPKKKAKKMSLDIAEKRQSLDDLTNKRSSILFNTADALADSVKSQYLTAMCTIDPDTGEQYFEDYEDYIERSNEVATVEAFSQMIFLLNDLSPDYVKKRVENEFFIKNKMMNDDGFFVNDDGKKVDKDGRLISDDFRYIDENGNYINEFGSKIDKDGNLVVDDSEIKPLTDDKSPAKKDEKKEDF